MSGLTYDFAALLLGLGSSGVGYTGAAVSDPKKALPADMDSAGYTYFFSNLNRQKAPSNQGKAAMIRNSVSKKFAS